MQKASDKDSFKKMLRERKIGVVFRENDEKRIYGVTFIDYQNRTILNGSRLGKEFSANVFHEMFNNSLRQAQVENRTKQTEPVYHSQNADLSLGSVFGLLDMPQSGNDDYEEENFVRNQECEAKRRRLKGKRKGRRI